MIYHDPCYLSRGVGVIEEPREVLRSIPGLTLLEFERHGLNSRCCGSGGAARKVFHENAIAMGRLTIDEAVAKKADRLILSCPACYAKVNEAMQGYEKQIRITDIMELLASVLEEGRDEGAARGVRSQRFPVLRYSCHVEFHGPEHQPVDGDVVVGPDADQLVDDRGVDAGRARGAARPGTGGRSGGGAPTAVRPPRRSWPERFACSARRIPIRLATSPCWIAASTSGGTSGGSRRAAHPGGGAGPSGVRRTRRRARHLRRHHAAHAHHHHGEVAGVVALRDLVLQEFLEPPLRGGQGHPVGDHARRGAGVFLGVAAEARARRRGERDGRLSAMALPPVPLVLSRG